MSALWVSFFKQDDHQKILDFNTIINSIILLINTFYLHGNFFGLISQPTDEMDNIFDKVIYVLKLNSNKQKKINEASNYLYFTSSKYFKNLYPCKSRSL